MNPSELVTLSFLPGALAFANNRATTRPMKLRRFATPARRIRGEFRDMSGAEACETPYTQHHQFGAEIAFANRNV